SMIRFRFSVLLAAAALSLAPASMALEAVPLISATDSAKGWSFNNGQEFGGGAKGGLEVDPSASREGKPSLRLTGDFTKAGMYVQAGRPFPKTEIRGLSMWVKNPGSD